MKAMILAAGYGKRLQGYRGQWSKPLQRLHGIPLIEHALQALIDAGISEIVINLGWRGAMLRRRLGDGRRWGIRLQYSNEGSCPRESAGGIIRALPLLRPGPFIVVNADVFSDYPLYQLKLPCHYWGHLILVNNPSHHRRGDFSLCGKKLMVEGRDSLTFSGIAIYHPLLFRHWHSQRGEQLALRQVLQSAIRHGRVSGAHYEGRWFDLGSPRRLLHAEQELKECI